MARQSYRRPFADGTREMISSRFNDFAFRRAALEAFDSQGNYANSNDTLFRLIGTYLAPDDPPPPVPGKS